MKDIRIAVRVTAKEKEKIQSKARTCGLSTTEYVKQRALGVRAEKHSTRHSFSLF